MNYSDKQWLDNWLKADYRKFFVKKILKRNKNNKLDFVSFFIFTYNTIDVYYFNSDDYSNTDTRFSVEINQFDILEGQKILRIYGDKALINWLIKKNYLKKHNHIDHCF